MELLPALQTERLTLRAFTLADAPRVRELAGAREVAEMTALIPHPYPEGAAEAWIGSHAERLSKGEVYSFAITLTATGALLGAIGLHVEQAHRRAELGYWIGVPYWGKGYATEAGRRVVAFGFETLELNRIYARYFAKNPASRRVQEKIGLRYEGMMKQAEYKWGEFLDIGLSGLTRDAYHNA